MLLACKYEEVSVLLLNSGNFQYIHTIIFKLIMSCSPGNYMVMRTQLFFLHTQLNVQ
jgi:hypothetical protein